MANFKGEYQHTIDSKGRVSFPAKLRKYLSSPSQDRFTILKGLERCLLLYPEDEWKKVEQHLSSINTLRSEERTVLRHFLRFAEDLQLDSHNRLAIPASLARWASIDTHVTFIGMGDRVELWSPDVLAREDEQIDQKTYNEMFEKVMGDV